MNITIYQSIKYIVLSVTLIILGNLRVYSALTIINPYKGTNTSRQWKCKACAFPYNLLSNGICIACGVRKPQQKHTQHPKENSNPNHKPFST